MQTKQRASGVQLASHLLILFAPFFSFNSCWIVKGQDPVETIRIDSDLVDLKVSVLGLDTKILAAPLDQKDFQVLEDGTPQEIALFEAADAPFDLVLLLDLSGSTSDKLKMIRRSAKRFIDAARPIDRIAIVTFTDHHSLLSGFSLDRQLLKARIDSIDEAFGGTNFWDALNYSLREVVPQSHRLQRSAVVVMTDGVDNALPDVNGPGSRIEFADLITEIQKSETIIFPIYVDTEKEDVQRFHVPRSAYFLARQQLAQIALECGTNVYRAAKLKDLDQVYAQVIRDLGTVYSIGYRSSNRSLDGKWRSVKVQLVARPMLTAQTKRGYFARPGLESSP